MGERPAHTRFAKLDQWSTSAQIAGSPFVVVTGRSPQVAAIGFYLALLREALDGDGWGARD